MAKASGEMLELMYIPGVWERCLFIKKTQPGDLVQSLLQAKLSIRGDMSELRARLLRHEIQKTHPNFQVPWYPEDEIVDDEETDDSTYDHDDNCKKENWKGVEKRLLVTMFQAKIRILEEKLRKAESSASTEISGVGENENCNQFEQEFWNEEETMNQKQQIKGIIYDKKNIEALTMRSQGTQTFDQIVKENQIEYRIKCIELVDRWKFSYNQNYVDHFYIINELKAFQNYAKISDRVFFEILPRIFEGKAKLWYSSYSLKKWTWPEFEHEFLLNCPSHWIFDSQPFYTKNYSYYK